MYYLFSKFSFELTYVALVTMLHTKLNRLVGDYVMIFKITQHSIGSMWLPDTPLIRNLTSVFVTEDASGSLVKQGE